MHSRATKRFWDCFDALPSDVRTRARRTFETWQKTPNYPALRFRRVHLRREIYSVRIGLGWRALGVMQDDVIIWFWIGSHADYDHLISRL